MTAKPRVAVHKFSSCDGCQLAFLNMGEDLLTLSQQVDILHFAEAGPVDPEAKVDVAFVEGSVSTMEEVERIKMIREHSRVLITIGACATSGGLQALRNFADVRDWASAIYAKPEYIHTLETATPIARHVKVDFAIWGCPINSRQLVAVLHSLLVGVAPRGEREKLCLECKRTGTVCGLVAHGRPCMGPVTQTGCGALCPQHGRECYSCYGPAGQANCAAMNRCFEGLGLLPDEIARRFLAINSGARAFTEAGLLAKGRICE